MRRLRRVMGLVRETSRRVPSSPSGRRIGLEASSGRCLEMRSGSSRERLLEEARWRAAREPRSLVQDAGACQFGILWANVR